MWESSWVKKWGKSWGQLRSEGKCLLPVDVGLFNLRTLVGRLCAAWSEAPSRERQSRQQFQAKCSIWRPIRKASVGEPMRLEARRQPEAPPSPRHAWREGRRGHSEKQSWKTAHRLPRTIKSRVPKLIWDFTKTRATMRAAADSGRRPATCTSPPIVSCAVNSWEARWPWSGLQQRWPFSRITSPLSRAFKRQMERT